MAFLPGIYENVFISKVEMNDKGTLSIGFDKASDAPAGDPNDLLAMFNSTSVDEGGDGQIFLMFKPQITAYGGEAKTAKQIGADFDGLRSLLNHLLLQYMTSDKIKWDLFTGLSLTSENFAVEMIKEGTINKVYENVCNQFIAMIGDKVGMGSTRLRIILPRKSKASPFVKLRDKFLGTNPAVESMEVSKEASKLKWNKYELENNLNTVLQEGAVEADDAPTTASNPMDDVFGG